jgi:hypothetical protein
MKKLKTFENYISEKQEVEEGNAFGEAVKKAKDAGESEFEFDGETYKVEEQEVSENRSDSNSEYSSVKDLLLDIGDEMDASLKDVALIIRSYKDIEYDGVNISKAVKTLLTKKLRKIESTI